MSGYTGFVFSPGLCSGCMACIMACKAWHGAGPAVSYRRVLFENSPEGSTNFYSVSCVNCTACLCEPACPGEAFAISGGGLMLLEVERCTGCGNCLALCPYGAVQFEPVVGKAVKCNFCFDRLADGMKPVCVQSCPTGALGFGEAGDTGNFYESLNMGLPSVPDIGTARSREDKAAEE